MKLLYITNGINGSGGLERVLAVKASYLAEKFDYQVHILTLNNGYSNPFYEFSPLISYYDIKACGNPLRYFLSYRNGIKKVLNKVIPDVISVCDDGLKGLLFPLIFGRKIPTIYERHVSLQIFNLVNTTLYQLLKSKILYNLMQFGASRFKKFIVLTDGNLKDWKLTNLVVIPNPLPFENQEKSSLKNKKVIAVGKQSFQKSYDRLLKIWSIIKKNHPEWELEIYGKLNPALVLENMAENLGLSDCVKFYPPTKDISSKYKEASIYVMTSRFEGFGMVLIEAMSFGLPCVAFDCPFGPSDIIKNNEDGFLIEDGNIAEFSKKLSLLINNGGLRKDFGNKAIKNLSKYRAETIVQQWDLLFNQLAKQH
jgi:glycosyltransferase involved in cell wall biosynthesis